jgi:hypothetical protein
MAARVIDWVGNDYENVSKVLVFFEKLQDELIAMDDYMQGGDSKYSLAKHEEAIAAATALNNSIYHTFGKLSFDPFRAFSQRSWFNRH